MPRGFGHKNYSPEEIDFVRMNYKSMSDSKMAEISNCQSWRIKAIRRQFNWSRYIFSTTDIKTRVFIAELFMDNVPMKEIAGIVGKCTTTVSKVVDRYLGVTKTGNTVTITLQSAV